MRYEIVLRDCHLSDGEPLADIGIVGGRIVDVAPDLPPGAREIHAGGRVVLPGLIDAHTHLDKTLSLDRLVNRSGTLLEAIDLWRGLRGSLSVEDFTERALGGVRLAVAAGTTAIRSHADIGVNIGLKAVEALLAVKERCRGKIDVQVVALAHLPSVSGPEAALVEEAVRLGADAVGGAPHIDGDPHASIDFALGLAEKYGKPVDLHMDERDDPSFLYLEYLAEQTIARGLQGRVTAGHCCSLAAADHATAERVMEKVFAAGIHVITLPSCNLYLQGRGDRGLIRRGLTRVKELLARGVNVVTASDNVQDPFNPLGKGDPLLIGNLTAHAAHMGSGTEQATVLEMLTSRAARCIGLADYGLAPGCQADLVVLDCTRLQDVLALLPTRLYVLKAGQVVAQSRLEQRVDL